MPLDLEEQEQVAELKAWWNRWGTIVMALAVAAALGASGWAYWKNREVKQSQQASSLYETLARAAQAGDAKTLRDASGALVESYPRSHYASMGALVAARYYFDHQDLKSAKAQLQWVIERAATDDFRDLARLRLAAVLLDEKAYDEALAAADAPHAAAYDSQFAAIKGDILVAKKQPAEARSAYKLALDKALEGDTAFRNSVRMRLEALGG
jgi:predicted negative regulator of RcsB-dependent stress response